MDNIQAYGSDLDEFPTISELLDDFDETEEQSEPATKIENAEYYRNMDNSPRGIPKRLSNPHRYRSFTDKGGKKRTVLIETSRDMDSTDNLTETENVSSNEYTELLSRIATLTTELNQLKKEKYKREPINKRAAEYRYGSRQSTKTSSQQQDSINPSSPHAPSTSSIPPSPASTKVTHHQLIAPATPSSTRSSSTYAPHPPIELAQQYTKTKSDALDNTRLQHLQDKLAKFERNLETSKHQELDVDKAEKSRVNELQSTLANKLGKNRDRKENPLVPKARTVDSRLQHLQKPLRDTGQVMKRKRLMRSSSLRRSTSSTNEPKESRIPTWISMARRRAQSEREDKNRGKRVAYYESGSNTSL